MTDKANIILTHNCNLRCIHCYMNAGVSLENSNQLFEKAKKLIDNLKKNNFKTVMFTGGECTILPWIEDIVKYAKNAGLSVEIFTNGMICNEALFDMVDLVHLSIDGLKGTHNFIRSNDKSFDNLIKVLNYLKKIDRITHVQITLNNKNFAELDEISKFLLDYLCVRSVKLMNQTNDGRAVQSGLVPIDMKELLGVVPKLYKNTKYHIQFKHDFLSKYDFENYYLKNQIVLPLWFDLVRDIYYIHDEKLFLDKIANFSMDKVGDIEVLVNKGIVQFSKNRPKFDYIDVADEISNLFRGKI